MKPLTVAIPKGRVTKQLAALLARASIDASCILADDRRLDVWTG